MLSFEMILKAPSGDSTLDRMIDTIVERFSPTRIVLFGSRARGDARPDSDYDLMVEIDSELPSWKWRSDIERVARHAADAHVDIHVRRPGQLEARRDDPGYIDWDIWRDGIIVYPAAASGRIKLVHSLERPDRVREQPESPPESVSEWLFKAEEDLLAIENNLASERVPWGPVCFHAQQAAEKYLKVLLIQRRIRPPRVHDLADLVAACRRAGYQLADLSAECEVLYPFAVEVRYGGDLDMVRPPIRPAEVEGRAAVDAARRIVDTVKVFINID